MTEDQPVTHHFEGDDLQTQAFRNRVMLEDAAAGPSCIAGMSVAQVMAAMIRAQHRLARRWQWRPFKGLLTGDGQFSIRLRVRRAGVV